MAYTKTAWVNDNVPALDSVNLNKIEQGIYDAHASLPAVPDAAWRLVGTTGNPAFASGWANYTGASVWGEGGFRRYGDGTVRLRGLVTASGLGGTGTAVFVLPVGYRPDRNLVFTTLAAIGSGVYVSRVDVYSTGDVFLNNLWDWTGTNLAGGTDPEWLSLAPISFHADQ